MARHNVQSVRAGNEQFRVEIDENGAVRIEGIDGAPAVTPAPDGAFLVSWQGVRYRVFVAVLPGGGVQAFLDGECYELQVEREGRPGRSAARHPHVEPLTVPMPARVVKVLASEGQAVRRGEILVTLEAMKMELPLKAPRDGTVRTVACREGDLVQPGATVVELS